MSTSTITIKARRTWTDYWSTNRDRSATKAVKVPVRDNTEAPVLVVVNRTIFRRSPGGAILKQAAIQPRDDAGTLRLENRGEGDPAADIPNGSAFVNGLLYLPVPYSVSEKDDTTPCVESYRIVVGSNGSVSLINALPAKYGTGRVLGEHYYLLGDANVAGDVALNLRKEPVEADESCYAIQPDALPRSEEDIDPVHEAVVIAHENDLAEAIARASRFGDVRAADVEAVIEMAKALDAVRG